MIDVDVLHRWAHEAGFCDAALCDASDFVLQKESVEAGECLKERRQLLFEPKKDDSRTKSLAVLLWPYKPAPVPAQGHVFVDSYYHASNAAYHAAKELEKRLQDAGCFARANVGYPAKAAALRADLGVIGMNDLLITKANGSRVVIILMATDMEVKSASCSSEKAVHACIQCGRCTSACPTGALTSKGMEHPERCLRNHMMEGTIVPEDMRRRMNRNLIGCDVCQRVCPMQPAEARTDERSGFLLSEFVTDEPEVFAQSAARLAQCIGKNAARPQRIRAQAAILAGNSCDEAYLPVLRKWAELPFEAVSVHAKWAIEMIESHQKRAPGP